MYTRKAGAKPIRGLAMHLATSSIGSMSSGRQARSVSGWHWGSAAREPLQNEWLLKGWNLSATLRVDNVLDRRYAGSVIVNEGNSRFYEPAPGRSYIAKLVGSYAF